MGTNLRRPRAGMELTAVQPYDQPTPIHPPPPQQPTPMLQQPTPILCSFPLAGPELAQAQIGLILALHSAGGFVGCFRLPEAGSKQGPQCTCCDFEETDSV